MAEDTSVGTSVGVITLDLRIASKISEQLNAIASGANRSAQNSFSSVGKSIEQAISKPVESAGKSIEKAITAPVENAQKTVQTTLKKTEQQTDDAISQVNAILARHQREANDLLKEKVSLPESAQRFNSTMATDVFKRKPDVEASGHAANAPPDLSDTFMPAANTAGLLQQKLSNVQMQFDAQREKLAALNAEFSKLSTGTKAWDELSSKITEAESRLISLQSTMNATQAKIDEPTRKAAAAAEKAAQAQIKAQEKAAVAAEKAADKVARANEKAAASTKRSGSVSAGTIRTQTNAMLSAVTSTTKGVAKVGVLGRTLSSSLTGSLAVAAPLALAAGAFEVLRKSMSLAKINNDDFKNSLNSLKANLAVAFTPIYQAILPALNSLMAGLATVAKNIAAFISGLFGKSYADSLAATKKMQEAAKKAKKSTGAGAKEKTQNLAAFDQINTINKKNGSGSSGANADVDDIDFSKIDAKGTESAQSLGEKIRQFFLPVGKVISDWWNSLTDGQKWGAGIGGTAGAAIGGIIGNLIGGPIGRVLGMVLGAVIGALIGAWWAGLTDNQKWGAGIGAGAGAVIGGIVGGLIGGPMGVAIGAALGGTIGAITGKWWSDLTTNQKWSVGIGAGAGAIIGGIVGTLICPGLGTALGAGLGAGAGGAIGYFWDNIVNWFKSSSGIGTATGAVIGGVIGTIICPGIGTVLGAALGGTLGGTIGANIKGIGKWFGDVWDGITKTFSDIGQWFSDVFTDAYNGTISAWNGTVDWFSNLWNSITGVFSSVGIWFSDTFSAAWNGIVTAWNGAGSWFSGIWNSIMAAFSTTGAWFSSTFSEAWKGIQNAFSAVGSFFSGIWNSITQIFSGVATWFGNMFSGAWNGMKNAFSAVGGFYSGVWSNIKSIFSSVGTWFGNIFKTAWDNITSVFSNVKGFFGGVWDGMTSGLKGAVNFVIDAMNSLINGINKIHVDIPSWAPGGARTLGFSIPTIPRLAKGGLVSQPTLAMVGDNPGARSDPEVISPLSKLQAMLSTQGSGNNSDIIALLKQILAELMLLASSLKSGSGDTVFPIYLGTELIDEIIYDAKQRRIIRSNGR